MAVLRCDRAFLYTWPEKELSVEEATCFDSFVKRRKAGEPVAYITGRRGFWNFDLRVNNSTLIPRPETELLVELALQYLPQAACKVIDLGTGSGAIALALAYERPQWQVFAVDAVADALALARSNAAQYGLERIRFVESNWFAQVADCDFDLVISNPPYVDAQDPHLVQGDVRFEPATALISADAGLADIRRISEAASSRLKPGGWLMFEHGYRQGEEARNILVKNHFDKVQTLRDLSGNERVTLGQVKHG